MKEEDMMINIIVFAAIIATIVIFLQMIGLLVCTPKVCTPELKQRVENTVIIDAGDGECLRDLNKKVEE